MAVCTISKEIGFDAGHRVPNHQSKCRNPHGHRYHLKVTCKGNIIEEPGSPDEGMLVDFSDLKTLMTTRVHDVLDHGFIVYKRDEVMLRVLGVPLIADMDDPPLTPQNVNGWKIIVFPYIPTAENIARWIWEQLVMEVQDRFRGDLWLDEVAVWETPTSVAYYRGE